MPPTTPRFANSQTSAHALGLACDTTHLYYASMADAPNACKSMWASIVGNNSKIYCSPWAPRTLVGKEGIKSIYQPLPGSSYTHLIAMTRTPELLIVTDPTAAGISDPAQRQALLDAHMPDLLMRFTSLLNAHTDTPVLLDWAADLWDAALAEYAVMPLETFGDCLAAWTVELTYDWTALVAHLLRQTILTL
ncbi:MAG: hypothetical protein DCC55_28340 [Chloroflexi bacterium]|nr:MAG: hypothetical protein DCC55_28340 [Chloroflexota bacterium]